MAFRTSKHSLKDGSKQITPVYTSSRDLMRKLISHRTSEGIVASKPGSVGEHLDALIETSCRRELEDDDDHQVNSTTGTYMLLSGREFNCPSFPVGFAAKNNDFIVGGRGGASPKKPRASYTLAQLDYLQWAYERGINNKADKMQPKQSELLMRLIVAVRDAR